MALKKKVKVIGGGLAGSELALQLASRNIPVTLVEMRPSVQTPVHQSGSFAELVCSNSLKSTKPQSAAGMLKHELRVLKSQLFSLAEQTSVPAGGALAVDRMLFSNAVTQEIERNAHIKVERREAQDIYQEAQGCDALVLATGPLTSDVLAQDISAFTGLEHLAFYDAAAPIVMAESLNDDILFRQSRYENAREQEGDYLNAPFTRDEYEHFIDALVQAQRVIQREFETRELFQACQPIEEIARKGVDAPRFGPLKPVGLTDPRTGRRPWAALQLRAEDSNNQCYNLVGFQTNLRFAEQQRVFRMIPGLEEAEFARYGVMHRNTFIDAPHLLDSSLCLTKVTQQAPCPIYFAGQLAGTEGYCEAIRSGLHVAIQVIGQLEQLNLPQLPQVTAFGALLAYATSSETAGYQPMHVNFGIMPPLDTPVKNKGKRYEAYAERGALAIEAYAQALKVCGL